MNRLSLISMIFSLGALADEPKFPGIKKVESFIPASVEGFTKEGPTKAGPKALGNYAFFTSAKGVRIHVPAVWDEGLPNEFNEKSFPGCKQSRLVGQTVLVCPKPKGMYRYAIWWRREDVDLCVGVVSDSPGTDSEVKAAATAVASQMLQATATTH